MGALLVILGTVACAGAPPLSDSPPSSVSAEVPTGQAADIGLPSPTGYTLPNEDDEILIRKLEIQKKRKEILYGPSLIGETSFFPSGQLGDQISQRDQSLWLQDSAPVVQAAFQEAAAALEDIQSHGGLQDLEDYKIMYDGHWSGSVPGGIAKGQFSNFTSDLLFAMERLSTNPYILQRLRPYGDELPFAVDSKIVQELTGSTLPSLYEAGCLFLADRSYQKDYVAQEGRYAAACQALFYLDDRSNQFLPLAIKTNVRSDLTYTPLDEPNDWLLAKVMFNVNDLFHGKIYHLTNSHAVAEIAHLAALRTMSSRHPVLALLERLTYQAYAIRPVGDKILFNPGGFFDQNFAFSNVAVRAFAADIYPTVAGPVRSNYFEANLRSRGRLNATYRPDLPHFPFYEDGARIIGAIRAFVTSFVKSTYKSDKVLSKDCGLQAWVAEANGAAMQLVDILTHMAWLTGVSHHVLNQGEPVTASGVEKGAIDSLLPWLPNEQKSVEQISLLARFNRPQVVENKQTLLHMCNSENLLAGTVKAVAAANERFMEETGHISQEISNREFNDEGLSQGMPFVWTGMDPGVIPFYLSV
ncbi:lipoxygenase [Dactylonectria estremocensis]|uniref:Manganese lipoxygenase n=1 Tax=Dactylonectria estremocensis TaxID=1079267 RepID=A0A9P9J822_9HYPO|nr:lipoxygenase [Dactylonectria estremocensis]